MRAREESSLVAGPKSVDFSFSSFFFSRYVLVLCLWVLTDFWVWVVRGVVFHIGFKRIPEPCGLLPSTLI